MGALVSLNAGVLIAVALAVPAAAQNVCVPPPGFIDTPPPTPAPIERLLSHTEQIVIDRPLSQVLAVAEATALEDTIDRASDLPGVSGTYNLTPGRFHAPGSRRLTCLTDGSTLVEQVLVQTSGPETSEFRYVVWNYSTAQARPIHYGIGRFVHTKMDDGRTHVRWTYAFKLRRDRLPGALGPLGGWLFRASFLDRQYATLMRNTLAQQKRVAEAS